MVVVYVSYPFVVFGKRSRDDMEDLNTLRIGNIGLYNLVFSFICNWLIDFISCVQLMLKTLLVVLSRVEDEDKIAQINSSCDVRTPFI